jgi:hypothetical protein
MNLNLLIFFSQIGRFVAKAQRGMRGLKRIGKVYKWLRDASVSRHGL